MLNLQVGKKASKERRLWLACSENKEGLLFDTDITHGLITVVNTTIKPRIPTMSRPSTSEFTEWVEGGSALISCMAVGCSGIDPRIPTTPVRGTSGFYWPGRHSVIACTKREGPSGPGRVVRRVNRILLRTVFGVMEG